MEQAEDRKRRREDEEGSDEYEDCVPLPEKRERTTVKVSMPIPEDCVGLVIGRCGTIIQRISQQSGCRVQVAVDKSTTGYRLVDIEGLPENIETAKQLINTTVANSYVQRVTIQPDVVPVTVAPQKITVDMMIPASKCGWVIGRGGETMRRLRSASNCFLTLIQDTNECGTEPKQLKIIGFPEDVENAKRMVNEIIASSEPSAMVGNGGETTVLQVRVPRGTVGAIMGIQGSNIMKISRETKCKLQFMQDDDAMLRERTLVIVGNPKNIPMAVQWIKDIVYAHNREDGTANVIFCMIVPAAKCGLVIGRGGETIKDINAQSGATCELSREASQNTQEKTFVIRGSEMQVEHAKHLIRIKVGDIPASTPFNPYATVQSVPQPVYQPTYALPTAVPTASIPQQPVDYSEQWRQYYMSMAYASQDSTLG